MEGGVPRVERPDSKRKNFHSSKQAGESHGNSESRNSAATDVERPSSLPLLLEGQKNHTQKNRAHKGTQRLSNVYSNHELDRGQNTLSH